MNLIKARTLIDEFPKSQPVWTLHKHLATKFRKVDKPERHMLRRPTVHQRAIDQDRTCGATEDDHLPSLAVGCISPLNATQIGGLGPENW